MTILQSKGNGAVLDVINHSELNSIRRDATCMKVMKLFRPTATLLIAHDVVAFAALPWRGTSQASTTTSNITSINASEILIAFERHVPHESADAFILPKSFFSPSSVSRFARVPYVVRRQSVTIYGSCGCKTALDEKRSQTCSCQAEVDSKGT